MDKIEINRENRNTKCYILRVPKEVSKIVDEIIEGESAPNRTPRLPQRILKGGQGTGVPTLRLRLGSGELVPPTGFEPVFQA